jgi:hypothetical protein
MNDMDCNIFYKNGKLLPWDYIPTWYVQFLATSPPDNKTKKKALSELKERGYQFK